MENTNTDDRKAAEFESKLLSGQRKEFFELGFMAGVKFAKSIHSTLDKEDVSQIIEDVKSFRLEYPGVLTVREAAANEAIDKTLKTIESWRESLFEKKSPATLDKGGVSDCGSCKGKGNHGEIPKYGIDVCEVCDGKGKMKNKKYLSEQPEVKPTESEQVEKCDNSHCEDGKVGELSGEIIYCGKCQDRLLESEKISMWWDWALSAWKKGKLRKKYFPSTTNLKPEQIEYIYKAEEALNSLKQ